MYKNNLTEILNSDLKSFIDEYLEEDMMKVALKFSGKSVEGDPIILEQLKLYKKAFIKLPTFTNAYCFFTSKSFEQASSENLALYKASLFSGKKMLDLSGGLGVDDWAFSKKITSIISLDTDSKLNQIVRSNFKKLKLDNIERLDEDATEYILKSNHFDLVYLDADRRPSSNNKRVLGLNDSMPNILQIKERLFELTDTILLKLSPMLDISALIGELKTVSEVFVVSLNNEVKELLLVLKNTSKDLTISAVDISKKTIQSFTSNEIKNVKDVSYSDEGSYFYEPSLSLIKSGLAKVYATENKLSVLAVNSYFFVSDNYVEDFFGRSFKVFNKIFFSKSAIKKYLSHHNITHANVSKRNFPNEVDELKKLFLIKDGGDDYLFFSQNNSQQRLMFHCQKIN